MADPLFPEVVIGPITYISIGVLLTLVLFLASYILVIKYNKRKEHQSFNLKKLNFPESRINILENIVDESQMQSNLPNLTSYSKATVSQSLEDLKKEGLIKRKKRGNSYLIEPNMDRIKEKCSI